MKKFSLIKKWLLVSIIGLTFGLTGCVSTSTVSSIQTGDGDLECNEIATRIGEVQAARSYASSKKGASGENVAAVLFFWPALLVNSSNTSKMIDSMNARETRLSGLYDEKQCTDEIPQYTNEEIQEKLKNKDTLESFS